MIIYIAVTGVIALSSYVGGFMSGWRAREDEKLVAFVKARNEARKRNWKDDIHLCQLWQELSGERLA